MKLNTLEYKKVARMSRLGNELRDRLPKTARAVLDEVGELLRKLATLTAELVSARGRVSECARIKAMARADLRADLVAIQRTARALSLESSGLDPRRFRTPPNGDQRLLVTASSVAAEAAPLKAAFLAHAMAGNFLDVLNSHIREFERSGEGYAAAVREREDTETQIDRAMIGLRSGAQRLDASVRNALGSDSTALAAWERACQFGKARVSKRAAGAAAKGAVAEAVSPEEAA